MEKQKRKEYFWVTLGAFIGGFVLYGAIEFIVPDSAPVQTGIAVLDVVLGILILGLMGGYMVSSIASGIMLFSRFIKKRSTAFKFFCALLFIIPFAAVFYTGVIASIPYGIYNIVMLLKKDKI
ncbi:MAG: hypothetical protein FWE86_00485 [Oscillospiraceae bacterium]|nr:hypothetical protein [Oscillospiraceae bacterium]